ncbi:hypothetical protein EDC56_1108 [Sinobacterium caligoides]|uniref:Uncharacterized protein n=1 Tax=Sinobacterium caligoides TaxID=933926 RepID=A0A3N2E0D5_9GAMM|nr:hypothetical protein [Sinobacterium caligoides]ROS05571.1 hypothetical protein EDC56_1108 [Sinobacterium caligoides]
MGKKKDPFAKQLKTVVSIEEAIDAIVEDYEAKKKVSPELRPAVFRSLFDPHSATTYHSEKVGRNVVIYGANKEHGGLKDGDYLLSPSDPNIVLASDCHGLSFNSTTKSTIDTLRFLAKFQPKNTRSRVAYWIDEDSPMIPSKLAFRVDQDNDTHYFLAVIEEMTVTQLIEKLRAFGQRMAIMDDLTLETFKA